MEFNKSIVYDDASECQQTVNNSYYTFYIEKCNKNEVNKIFICQQQLETLVFFSI